jgi:DinB superfamily
MSTLHDERYRSDIKKRLHQLHANSQRQWGKMSVGQMLWHVNEWLDVALGKILAQPQKSPLPRFLMKFVVINLPWPKGAPTLPMFVAQGDHDFESERDRCLRLIDEFASRKLEDEWPPSPVFGPLSGREASKLQAKHLNHHLKQFSA